MGTITESPRIETTPPTPAAPAKPMPVPATHPGETAPVTRSATSWLLVAVAASLLFAAAFATYVLRPAAGTLADSSVGTQETQAP